MRILLISAYFIPEIGSAAHIYFDLAKSFVSRGHEVDVITSYPRTFNLHISDQKKQFTLTEIIEGITVHRCRHPANRDNIVVRGLEHFYLPYYYFRKYREIQKKFDVCLLYIPPLPLYYLAKKIKRYDKTPSVLNIQDFHPQELTDVGVLKNPVLIKILEYIEKSAYKNADYITVISSGGITYVQQKGADPTHITHLFNAVNLSAMDETIKIKNFKEKNGMENHFIISYAGILSPYQGITNILDVAKSFQDQPNILFCIAGDGSERNRLIQIIIDENITNVRIFPLLPRDEYFNLVNSSDISCISLDERMKAPCLPGKTINLMACSQPIIALVPGDSETAKVIQSAECGIVIEPGNIDEMKSAILFLIENPDCRIKMGTNGRNFLNTNMNVERNATMYEYIFRKMMENDT